MSHVKGNSMPELSRSLQPRHITMISIGGMIGAGLFVSSSAPAPALEMARQLFWSVVSLAVAVGAFLTVDTWRKARAVARTAPAAPGAHGS
jgi:amino acid transporter